MLGNFSFYNPTRIYFGKDSLDFLREEMPKYGETVMVVYGGGSIKKNGIYDSVIRILTSLGKRIIDDGGVLSNPTVERLNEGRKLARKENIDFILAIGGGSACDYAKAVSASTYFDGDPWEYFYVNKFGPDPGIFIFIL